MKNVDFVAVIEKLNDLAIKGNTDEIQKIAKETLDEFNQSETEQFIEKINKQMKDDEIGECSQVTNDLLVECLDRLGKLDRVATGMRTISNVNIQQFQQSRGQMTRAGIEVTGLLALVYKIIDEHCVANHYDAEGNMGKRFNNLKAKADAVAQMFGYQKEVPSDTE